MARDVVLYNWPDSQVCLGCIHSVAVIPVTMEADEQLGYSASVCLLNQTKKEGSRCPKFRKGKVVEGGV